jgi:hypothetical protein
MDEGTFGRGKPSAAIGRLSNSAYAEERSDDATLELLFGGAAVLTLLGSAAIPNAAHVSLVHLAKPANFDRQAASLQGAATALLTRRS